MTNVQSIKKSVAQLPMQDLAEFRSWFAKFDVQVWDAQLEDDAVSGKLNTLAQEALTEYKLGKARELKSHSQIPALFAG